MSDYDRVLLWDKSMVGMQSQKTSYEVVKELHLRARLLRTCVKYGGVGLAAPQIGMDLSVCLINFEDTTKLLINPEIVASGEDRSGYTEGCLSWPLCSAGRGHHKTYEGGVVVRPDSITVKYQTETGEEVVEEFKEFMAHIVAHELDHLVGRFYVEHLGSTERDLVFRKFRRFKKYFEVVETVN